MLILLVLTYKILWLQRNKLLLTLNETKISVAKSVNCRNRIINYSIQVVLPMLLVVYYYYDHTVITAQIKSLKTFGSNDSADYTTAISLGIRKTVENFFANCSFCYYMFARLQVHTLLFYAIIQIYVFMLVTTVLLNGLEFRKDVANLDMLEIIFAYRKLKRQVSLINDISRWHIFCYFISGMASVCRLPDILIGGVLVEATSIFTVTHFILLLAFCVMSAEFHAMIHKTMIGRINSYFCKGINKKWTESKRVIDLCYGFDKVTKNTRLEMRLLAIKSEIYVDPPGLSGRYFTLTYQFLSSVSSLKVLL